MFIICLKFKTQGKVVSTFCVTGTGTLNDSSSGPMPLLASLATIPAEITLLSFTKENKTEYNSQLFHIALIKRKNIQYLEPSIVTSKGYDDDEDDDNDDDDNNDDHEGEDIWQVLNSESFLIMKIINETRMIELSVIRYQNHHGKKR